MKHCFLVLGLVFAPTLFAQVTVSEPWVRATVANQRGTGAYMQLTAGQHLKIVEVRSPSAKLAEIHEMTMVDNVMRMRPVHALDLPAGKTVELKPNGYHVMLMGLTAQIKDGDTVAITLTLEDKDKKRATVEINAPARPLNYAPGGGHAKH